jgi:hypothetical protein
VNSIKREVVDSELNPSGNSKVAQGRTCVFSTGTTCSFPVAGSEQSLLAVLSVPPNNFLRLFTSLGALILVGRTSEMQILSDELIRLHAE